MNDNWHIVNRASDVRSGDNIALHAVGYQCRCGWSTIDLTAVAEHVVRNQYEVKPPRPKQSTLGHK